MELALNGTHSARWLRGFVFSIRGKMALFACLIAFVAAFGIGNMYAQRMARDIGTQRLITQTELLALQFQQSFNAMQQDALTLSHVPDIEGIERARLNGGLDPVEGSTTDIWRERLANIFIDQMRAHPHYLQMRYIGVADNGMEIVRVNHLSDEGIAVVPDAQLTPKGREAYYQEALKTGLTDKDVYFSTVQLNYEHGIVEQPHRPVIRVIRTVRNAKGQAQGMLMIVADYNELLRRTMRGIFTHDEIYLVNSEGDYMMQSANGDISPFYYRSDPQATIPDMIKIIRPINESVSTFFTGDDAHRRAVHYTRLFFSQAFPDRWLGIAIASPVEKLFATPASALRDTAALAAGFALVAFLLALYIARMFTMPLEQINREVQAYGKGKHHLDLPTRLKDEIGQLARSLKEVYGWLDEAQGREKATLARLKAIVDKSVDGIILMDERGTVQQYNPGCVSIFGFAPDEVIGQNIKMLMPPRYADNHDGYLAEHRRTGKEHIIGTIREVEGRRKNGAVFPVELSVSLLEFEDGLRMYSGIVRDITVRKEYEGRIQRYNEELERSNRELDDFAYIASHDLKEPLRAISNHTTFLYEDHIKEMDSDAKSRVDRIRKLCERAEKLVSDLLYFSRLGRGDMVQTKVDLNDVVEDIRSSFSAMLEEQNAEIVVSNKLPALACDLVRTTSVFQNLIINGIKYNDNNPKIIEIGYMPTGTDHNGKMLRDVFFVRDNGIGIAPEYQEHVFRLFKRLNSPAKYGDGTGAGLTFVKKIIERHGGQIWLESDTGHGSTFYFTLTKGDPA